MPVESTPTIRLEEPAAPVAATAPPLNRIVVAQSVVIDPLLGKAQGAVEMLRSALESAREAADAAELALGEMPADSAVDAEWDTRLQAIQDDVRQRRDRMDAELDAARRQAAELLDAARADAARMARTARAELDRTLSGSAGPPDTGRFDPAGSDPPLREPVAEQPAATRVRLDDQWGDPVQAAFAAEQIPGAESVVDTGPTAGTREPASAPQEPPVPDPQPEPQLPPAAAFSTSGMPPFVAVMVPSADGSGQPTYVLAPTVGMTQWPTMPAGPSQVGPYPPSASPYPPSATPYPYPPVNPYPPSATPYTYPVPPSQSGPVIEAGPRSDRRGGLSRVLHIDVILPLLAVAIVIVVLLAWLG